MSGTRCSYSSFFKLDASSLPTTKPHTRSQSASLGIAWTLSTAAKKNQACIGTNSTNADSSTTPDLTTPTHGTRDNDKQPDKHLAASAARASIDSLEHLTIVIEIMPTQPTKARKSQISCDGEAPIFNSEIDMDQPLEPLFCLSEIVETLTEFFYLIFAAHDEKNHRTIAHMISVIIAQYCPLKFHPLHSFLESITLKARDSISSVISLNSLAQDAASYKLEILTLGSDDKASCDSAIDMQLIADEDHISLDDQMFPEAMIDIVREILFSNTKEDAVTTQANVLCEIIASYFPLKLLPELISAIQQAGDRGPIPTITTAHAHSRFTLLNNKNVLSDKINNQANEPPAVEATALAVSC